MAAEGLFHVSIKLGRRSRGQSAVAAAAYRAAARLKDNRTGLTFNFTRKSEVIDSFILAPAGAPAWTQDRESLWNRVEAAEKRKDAQLWREVEVSIPRDIPADRRADFIRDACRKYIEAGVVCDIAIHCPAAADGGEQPHAHIMMPLRSIDPGRDTGFASKKNALDHVFSSGGRYGGTKGEAMKAERARWADTMNKHLRAARSLTRVDPRSYRDRGIKREPEPKIGEVAASRFRRGHGPSDHQRAASALRIHRRAQAIIINSHIEECTMQGQAMKPGNPQRNADFKQKLLKEFFPDLKDVDREALWRITKNKDRIRVAMRDGSMISYKSPTPYNQSESLQFFGGPGRESQAAKLAQQIAQAHEIDGGAEYVPAVLAADSPKRRKPPTAEERAALAERWRARGFTDVDEVPRGAIVHLGGGTQLYDTGSRVTLSGPVTDEAIRAMVEHTRLEWGGSHVCSGSRDYLDRMWLESQRQGVKFSVKDRPEWQPSEKYRKQWEREQASRMTIERTESAAMDKLEKARAVIAFARGERDEPPAGISLTDDQKSKVAGMEPVEVAAKLNDLQGQAEEEGHEQAVRPEPEVRPVGNFSPPSLGM